MEDNPTEENGVISSISSRMADIKQWTLRWLHGLCIRKDWPQQPISASQPSDLILVTPHSKWAPSSPLVKHATKNAASHRVRFSCMWMFWVSFQTLAESSAGPYHALQGSLSPSCTQSGAIYPQATSNPWFWWNQWPSPQSLTSPRSWGY